MTLPLSVWISLLVFVVGISTLAAIRALFARQALARVLLRLFAALPGWTRGVLALSRPVYVLLLVLSLGVGTVLYAALVRHFSVRLYEAFAHADVVSEILSTEPGQGPLTAETRAQLARPKSDVQSEILFRLLSRFGLSDATEKEPASLRSVDTRNAITTQAWDKAWAGAVSPPVTTVELIAGLISSGQTSCCPKEFARWHSATLAAALANQPVDWHDESKWSVQGKYFCAGEPAKGGSLADCRTLAAELGNTIGSNLSLRRSLVRGVRAELSPQEVIRLARPHWRMVEDVAKTANEQRQFDARDLFIARLITELRGAEEVRAARRWLNGIIGWERWLIIVLAVWFCSVFLCREVIQLPHLLHGRYIAESLTRFHKAGRQADATQRLEFARKLANDVIGGSPPGDKVTTYGVVKTIPSRLLVSATEEMASLQALGRGGDRGYIETIANGERLGLEHSRLFFDAMLPTFPAIGFIGTVSSLLVAMSKADRIVSTSDLTAKGIAAAQVTDILSLCFSTTFMALMCVLVFSPLALAQRSREDALVDGTEYALQQSLKPEQS